MVKLHTKDEDMMVHAFRKRVLSRPFSDSLIRCRPKTLCEIRCRAVPTSSQKGRSQKNAVALAQSDLGEPVVLSL